MEVVRPADAATFLDLAGPLLLRDEVRHNLILGIAGTAIEHPDAYDELHLWIVLDGGAAVAAALRTPPHNLVVADPASGAALDVLLAAIVREDPEVPGVMANVPFVDAVATALAGALRRTPERILRQGVFELTDLRPVHRPEGAPRVAKPADRALVRSWLEAFLLEAVPEPEVHLQDLDKTVDARLAGIEGGFWLWDTDEAPVSVSGFGGRTPTGMRVGPVYTPPERRRGGYATALVADLSADLLGRGLRACFLFTDLSNPTSNRIYQEVGYRQVAEADVYRFA